MKKKIGIERKNISEYFLFPPMSVFSASRRESGDLLLIKSIVISIVSCFRLESMSEISIRHSYMIFLRTKRNVSRNESCLVSAFVRLFVY